MLDDLKMIHERDKSDALGVSEKQWQQLTHEFNIQLDDIEGIENIIISGMGGSTLPAVYIKSWPDTLKPMEIVRDYDIPEYVNEKTLFISSSYSGNTEETLAAIDKADQAGAQIVVVGAGGKLLQLAKDKNYPFIEIPGGIQPRMCVFYFLSAFLHILDQLKLIKEGSLAELKSSGQWLNGKMSGFLPTVPTSQNLAKQLALELIGKSVVVYSGPKLFPSANKFKICINENAKNVAWVNQYSEFNHNEFMGWTSKPEDKPYAVVEIRSSLENDRMKKRFEVTEQLLSGKRPSPIVITPLGENLIQQLLWASNFCDFISIYAGLLNGVDPSQVDLAEKFKTMLG
jgi:glucose/mannose-6-phosphate isomerase